VGGIATLFIQQKFMKYMGERRHQLYRKCHQMTQNANKNNTSIFSSVNLTNLANFWGKFHQHLNIKKLKKKKKPCMEYGIVVIKIQKKHLSDQRKIPKKFRKKKR
jgi:hypothetical protein